MVSKMMSTVIFLLLLHLAASVDIVFLSPRPGQEFSRNDTIPQVKWKKIPEATKFSVTWKSDDGIVLEANKTPSRCNPRIQMPEGLQQGFLSRAHQIPLKPEIEQNATRTWLVQVIAQNAAGEIIGVKSITFSVCPQVPCTKKYIDCPLSITNVRYYTAPGYKVQGSSHYTFQAANEKECVDICNENAVDQCKSINFNQRTKMCEMYSTATLPQGSTQLIKDTATTYYEKACVNTALTGRCPGPYFVEPRMGLLYLGVQAVNVTEMRECLEYCLDSQTHFGFVCLVAGFVVNYGYPDLCVLTTQSRWTNPDSYVSQPDSTTYLEPGCAIAMQ